MARQQRTAIPECRPQPKGGERLVLGLVGDHRDRPRAAVREGEQSREAHVLRADDHRTAPGALAVQVDELLERARGHHALWAGSRDQACRPRPLSAPRCEDHRARLELVAAGRRRDLERAVLLPPGHLRLGADLGAA